MRVLALTHVFPRAPDDPTAPFLLHWARGLADAGACVTVVAPHDAGLPLRHRVARVPVRRARYAPDRWETLAHRGRMHEVVRSPAGPPLLAGLVGALAAATRAELRAGVPDVLHVHWWLPGAVVARLARPRVPVVVTVHGTDVALLEQMNTLHSAPLGSRPALTRLARWALDRADRVEAVSSDLADRLERATGRRADAVNPMPIVEVGALSEPPAGPFAVLAAGRLVAEKGFGDLVAAVARLDVPARLTIAGDGPERAALVAQASTLGVGLDLPGALAPAALAARYAAAGVVVQPSSREGFGLVAAEALAAGVPLIATDSGGVRDLVARDELVAPGDVDGLTAALRTVLADPDKARALAADRADEIRTRLSPATAAARTLAGYGAVM